MVHQAEYHILSLLETPRTSTLNSSNFFSWLNPPICPASSRIHLLVGVWGQSRQGFKIFTVWRLFLWSSDDFDDTGELIVVNRDRRPCTKNDPAILWIIFQDSLFCPNSVAQARKCIGKNPELWWSLIYLRYCAISVHLNTRSVWLGLVDLPIMPLHLGWEFGDTAFQLFGGRLQSDPAQGALIAFNPNILVSGQIFDFYYSKYVYLRPDECLSCVYIHIILEKLPRCISKLSLSSSSFCPFSIKSLSYCKIWAHIHLYPAKAPTRMLQTSLQVISLGSSATWEHGKVPKITLPLVIKNDRGGDILFDIELFQMDFELRHERSHRFSFTYPLLNVRYPSLPRVPRRITSNDSTLIAAPGVGSFILTHRDLSNLVYTYPYYKGA